MATIELNVNGSRHRLNTDTERSLLSGQRGGFGGTRSQDIGAYLHVGEDGKVTVFTGKVEVGQNARTSLTQAVAEELRLPVAAIRLVMADTDRTPNDGGT